LKPRSLSARKTGLITNPHSRRNRHQLSALNAIVADHPGILHRIAEGPNQIIDVLREFAAAQVSVLAINGGDGTSARVFTELLEKRPFDSLPAVILLPGGTTNANANDVGLRGDLRRAASTLAAWASGEDRREQRVKRAILRVQNATGGEPLCGMFFGAGSVVRGIEYCHSAFHGRGIGHTIGPGVAILRVLWGVHRNEPRFATPTDMRLELGATRDTATREVLLMIITSLDRLILGMRPYWGREKGSLHCTWIEQPARSLMRLFPSVLRGAPAARATPEHGYFSHNSGRIRLWFDGGFTLDGEMHQASLDTSPLTISNGAELEFLRIDR
jgi:diacylglycerol kinase (ATP)